MAHIKTKKFRGSKTHGRGSMKKGRGAGSRGGRGKAGWGKHKFMHMLKVEPDHFGKRGFKRPQSVVKRNRVINVGELEEKFPNKNNIDLTQEGFDKLLGAGVITQKIKIKVKSASKKAIDKIKEKNGEITIVEEQIVEEQK